MQHANACKPQPFSTAAAATAGPCVLMRELAEEAQDWIVGHNKMDRLFGPILHAPVRSSSPPLFKLLRVYLSGLPEIQSTCLLSFYYYTAAADVLKCTAIILYSDYICRVINIRTNSKRVCSFPFHRLPIFSAAYKDGWGHCRVEDSMWKSIYTYGFLTIRKKTYVKMRWSIILLQAIVSKEFKRDYFEKKKS